MKPWTAEDIAILTSRFADESSQSIAEALGRSANSCSLKARKLGLAKSDSFMQSHRFRDGHKPRHAQPIGIEFVSAEGYLVRKVTDNGHSSDFVAVHRLVWEEHNGPIPAGHSVTFKDGDKENPAIDNLECISKVELVRRNSINRYPKEIRQLCHLRGRLIKEINKRSQT